MKSNMTEDEFQLMVRTYAHSFEGEAFDELAFPAETPRLGPAIGARQDLVMGALVILASS
jgi:hypothetical protein